MKKTALTITILFTMITLAGAAFAKGPGKGQWNQGRCTNSQGYGPMMSDLTPEQQQQLSDLRQAHHDQTAEQRIELIAKGKEMQVLLGTTEPDKARLVQLTREMASIKGQMAEKRIDFILEAKKIAPDLNFAGQCRDGNWHKGGFKGSGSMTGNRGCPRYDQKELTN